MRTRIRNHAKQVVRATKVHAPRPVFIGHWDATETYKEGDIVEFGNRIYEREDTTHALTYSTDWDFSGGSLAGDEFVTPKDRTRSAVSPGLPFTVMQSILPSGRDTVQWNNDTGVDFYPPQFEFHNTPIKAGGCAIWFGGDYRYTEVYDYNGDKGIEVNGYLFMDTQVPLDWKPDVNYVSAAIYRDSLLQQHWAGMSGNDPENAQNHWVCIGEANDDPNQLLAWKHDRQYVAGDLVQYQQHLYVAKSEAHDFFTLQPGKVQLPVQYYVNADHDIKTAVQLAQVIQAATPQHMHVWMGTTNQLIAPGPEWHGFELHPNDCFNPEAQFIPKGLFIDRGEIPGYPNTAFVNGWVIDDSTTRGASGGFSSGGAVYIRKKVLEFLHPTKGQTPVQEAIKWTVIQ